MTDYVSKYTLKFNDLASRGLLRTAAAARGLTRGLSNVGLASAAFGTIAAAASFKLANNVASRADEYAKLARQVDFSAQSLQRLEFMAGRQGASFQSVQAGIQTFSKRMGEFRKGTGALHTAMKKLHPELGEQLKATENNQEAYELFITTIGEMTDAQAKAALASAAVSKQGARDVIRLTQGGAEAMAALAVASDRLRPPLSDSDLALSEQYSDSMFDASQVVASLGDSLGTSLMPVLINVTDKFTNFIADNRELVNMKIDSVVGSISDSLQNLDFATIAEGAETFVLKVSEMADKVAGFVEMLGGMGNVVQGFIGLFVVGKIAGFVAALAPLVAIIGKGGPIGLGFAAIVTAGVLVYQNWDTIKERASQLKDKLADVWSWISTNLNFIPAVAAANHVVENWDSVKESAVTLKDTLADAWAWMKENMTFATVIGWGVVVKDSWNEVAEGAMSLKIGLETAWVAIQNGWSNAMNAIATTTRKVWDAITQAIADGINFIIEKINFVLSQYNSLAQTGFGEFAGLGQVDLLQKVDFSGPADSRVGNLDGTVKVEISGKVDGAKTQARVTGTGIVDAGGSNAPLEGPR